MDLELEICHLSKIDKKKRTGINWIKMLLCCEAMPEGDVWCGGCRGVSDCLIVGRCRLPFVWSSVSGGGGLWKLGPGSDQACRTEFGPGKDAMSGSGGSGHEA